MTTVTIESCRKDRKGFKADDIWYSSMQVMPQIERGLEVELIGYTVKEQGDRTYHNIKGVKVVGGEPAYKPAGGGSKSSGGGTARDEIIVRQNALTNASNLIAAGVIKGKTPADVLAVMEELAAGVLKKSAPTEVEEEAPKPKAKPKPQVAESENFDDDIPF